MGFKISVMRLCRLLFICVLCSLCLTVQAQKKKSDTKGAKKSRKNAVDTRPNASKIEKKAKKEGRSKSPGGIRKINPLESRRKGVSAYESEKKLHKSRAKGRKDGVGLPKENPIEWTIPQPRYGTGEDAKSRKFQGQIKMPTLPRARQIARNHSKKILDFSGKLNTIRPNNSRKHYFKVSRKMALYQGDLKIKWVHYHHRHPSLWRMGRNERPSSQEVYQNRKMAKKPKYDPRERVIWSKSRSRETPQATFDDPAKAKKKKKAGETPSPPLEGQEDRD